MKKEIIKSYLLAISCLITIPLLGFIYVYLNRPGSRVNSLVTDLDQQIPFLKVFVVPYLSWYVFLFLAFLYLAYKNRSMFYHTLLQFNIGLLFCYGVYAVYQTYVPRPDLSGDDWFIQLLHIVYRSDKPFNCFPSTHVLTSYLMMKSYLKTAEISRNYKIGVTITSLLIIASTQFIKQHVLLDIFGAIIVAEIVVYAISQAQKGHLFKNLLSFSQNQSLPGATKLD